MILVDSGALMTMVGGPSPELVRLNSVFDTLRRPLLTCEACAAEASYLSRKRLGWPAQRHLLNLIARRTIRVESMRQEDWPEVASLMDKYHDRPMDLADACLVILSERVNSSDILTLDSDFLIYRKRDGSAFNILNQIA